VAVLNRDAAVFPSFWRLQSAGWLGLYVLALLGLLPDLIRQPDKTWDTTVMIAMWFLASCVLRPVCRYLRRRSQAWMYLEPRAFACSMVMGTAVSAVGLIGIWYVRGMHQVAWVDLTNNCMRGSLALFFWCTMYFSVKQWQQLMQERERLLRAEADARAARLNALRYQLNPHFLFNSLNAVVTLIQERDVAAATEMLVQISDVLRTSLDDGLRLEVPLSQEMTFTRRYLAIEQVRLGERLRVDVELQPETLDAAVPSLLLQPLVENAVRHGVAPLVEGGTLAIRSERRETQLRLTIRNSGARTGDTAVQRRRTSGGIGLANTIERLRGLYGDDHSFVLQWPEEGGCEVTIELPYRNTATELQDISPRW
jgi:two-component system, LytTR family, sensor kinase